ncbi:CRACD-like protein [Passer montanus]|uniref:CRACD-like protein n=1 Tax=Passer montanus TaxID=9160 RepID=UPI00196001F3|nr:CRACD-like protein [Passer montanus]
MLLGKTNKTNKKTPKTLIPLRNSRSFVCPPNSRAALEMSPWREPGLDSAPAWNSSIQEGIAALQKEVPTPRRMSQASRGACWSLGRESHTLRRTAWSGGGGDPSSKEGTSRRGSKILGRSSQPSGRVSQPLRRESQPLSTASYSKEDIPDPKKGIPAPEEGIPTPRRAFQTSRRASQPRAGLPRPQGGTARPQGGHLSSKEDIPAPRRAFQTSRRAFQTSRRASQLQGEHSSPAAAKEGAGRQLILQDPGVPAPLGRLLPPGIPRVCPLGALLAGRARGRRRDTRRSPGDAEGRPAPLSLSPLALAMVTGYMLPGKPKKKKNWGEKYCKKRQENGHQKWWESDQRG